MRWTHYFAACVSCLITIVLLSGCGGGDNSAPAANITPPAEAGTTPANSSESIGPVAAPAAAPQVAPAAPTEPPRVVVKTTMGEITIELTPDKTPITVDNFLRNYVEAEFYSSTTFHYVDDGFMIAGGGFTADGKAKETRAAIRNEAHKGGSNVKGAVAMARDPQYIHSSTSQFLINLVDNPSLDHSGDEEENYGYCVFGRVIKGMDVLEQIAKVKVQDTEQFPRSPVESIVIQSIERVN